MSTWALTSSPPCYIFSPLETRLRGFHPIQYTLHHAIPMSMYAQPGPERATSPYRPSPTRSNGGDSIIRKSVSPTATRRRRHSDNSLPEPSHEIRSPTQRSYPRDPIASLTIVSTPVSQGPAEVPPSASTIQSNAKGYLQSDRIPLWALAPGMNVLQGSTSASIGIKLSDFSALNLMDSCPETGKPVPYVGAGHQRMGSKSGLNKTVRAHHSGAGELWIDSSPIQAKHKILVPPVEAISRPSTPATSAVEIETTTISGRPLKRYSVIEIDNKSSRHGRHHDLEPRSIHSGAHFQIQRHLTPPEKFIPPQLFASKPSAGAFPRLARIPHWKRGVKELMEDVLEELNVGLEVDGVLEGMRNLGLWDLEIGLHEDRVRRASENTDGSLLQNLGRTGR